MPHYHVAFNSKAGTNTANKIIVNLWAVSRKARVVEVGIFLQTVTATAPLFALQRASARGTQSTSLTPIQKDASDPPRPACSTRRGALTQHSPPPIRRSALLVWRSRRATVSSGI
jgi:hypothetical protein